MSTAGWYEPWKTRTQSALKDQTIVHAYCEQEDVSRVKEGVVGGGQADCRDGDGVGEGGLVGDEVVGLVDAERDDDEDQGDETQDEAGDAEDAGPLAQGGEVGHAGWKEGCSARTAFEKERDNVGMGVSHCLRERERL